MAAVGQVEAQHRVARLQRGEINGRVRLRAAVGLHVGEFGAEQLLGPVDGQLLHDVDELAAAVVPPARIALGIFVRQHAAGGLHHGRARVVLAGDHLQAVGLALDLRGDGSPNFRIVLFDVIGQLMPSVVSEIVRWQ